MFAEASSQGVAMADLDGFITYMNPPPHGRWRTARRGQTPDRVLSRGAGAQRDEMQALLSRAVVGGRTFADRRKRHARPAEQFPIGTGWNLRLPQSSRPSPSRWSEERSQAKNGSAATEQGLIGMAVVVRQAMDRGQRPAVRNLATWQNLG